ncbi:MAG: YdhR family protein [Verrucomicrobiota bacterium]|nr:YdhR family protein [Verrucomicrobiota bacterium]
MKDRLSKLSVLVVRYKYDLREDNDIIELSKDEDMLKIWSTIPGLGVKFALANPDENEYGGVYLFEDDAALEAFLASPLLKDWGEHPDVSELTYTKYQALPDFTLKTIKRNYVSGDLIKDLAPKS